MAPPLAPQQPGLRSFIVYDRAPEGWLPFTVATDDSAPHLRTGDTVLIDTTDRAPVPEELYLIEWQCGHREIVTCWPVVLPASASAASAWRGRLWVGRYRVDPVWREMMARKGWEPVRVGDGPYLPEQLEKKLIGRVVGIMEPSFAEPVRIAA